MVVPIALRYTGLAATALLAAGAWAAGALPGSDPAAELHAGNAGWRGITGLAVWLAGAVLLAVVWWRLGAVLRREPVPLGTLTRTAAVWAVPLLLAPPLGSRDVYAYACQGWVWLGGHDPYAAGVQAGGCPWLESVPQLWWDTPAPYGPFAVLLSGVAAWPGHLLVAIGLLRAVALVAATILLGYGVRLARRCGADPAVAAWLGVLTPLVAVHGISGVHNDLLLAALVVAGLATAAPGPRAALPAGVFLGLAAAVKVTAVVAWPFAVLLVAAGASGRAIARAAVPVAGAALGTFGLLSVATGLGLGWVRALPDTGSLVQWTSLPTGVGMTAGYLLRALGVPQAYEESVAVARALGLAVLLSLLVLLWLRARRLAAANARDVVVAGGAALAAVAVLAPVFYPWYALAPLAVLAFSTVDERVRRWLAVATVALMVLVLPSGLGLAVLTKLPGALLVTATAATALAWLIRRRGRPARSTATGS